MRCTNCGAELGEGNSFCTYCGAQQSAPVGYDAGYNSNPYGGDVYVPPITPKKKKSKSPLGLMIAAGVAGLLVITIILGLCTNWFGLYGPISRIAVAGNNTVKKGNFTLEMTTETEGGNEAETLIQMDIDLKKRTLTMLVESEGTDYWTNLNYTSYIAIYDGYAIEGKVYEDGRETFSKQDISDDIEKIFDAYEDAKDLNWDDLLETIEEETDLDLTDYIDIKAFKKCVKQYGRKLNNNKWLKENAGYSKSKKNGVTFYEFEPNNYKFLKSSLEFFQPAFEDEDDYDTIMDGLKGIKSDLNKVDLELAFGVKGNKLVEINAKVDVNGAEVEVSMEFKNIGKTTLDEDFLESMLDKAA